VIRHFERRVPELNVARFYRLEVERSLFGDWSLRRVWGRIGTMGRERLVSYPTRAAALAAVGLAEQRRRRRGYRALPDGPAVLGGVSVPAQLELPLDVLE
jgi:predicted DNA-binding WGR domain protein